MQVLGQMRTPDGLWTVQVVRYPDRTQWYRVVGPDGQAHERDALGTVLWRLGQAGYQLADLEPVEDAA